MAKSGILMAIVSLVLLVITTIIMYCCGPLVGIVLGLVAGILACVFSKPMEAGKAAGNGAGAGAIAGIGAWIGQIGGHMIKVLWLAGPEKLAGVSRDLAQQMQVSPSMIATDPTTVVITQFVVTCICGVVDLAVMAGFGALGGLVWYQVASKKTAVAPTSTTF